MEREEERGKDWEGEGKLRKSKGREGREREREEREREDREREMEEREREREERRGREEREGRECLILTMAYCMLCGFVVCHRVAVSPMPGRCHRSGVSNH